MIEVIKSAKELPDEWDQIAGEYFQRKEFLIHTEAYNPCNQCYYILKEKGHIVAGAVVYTLALDIFTYLKIKSPIKMRICGMPCSVSASGLLGTNGIDLLPAIFEQERGLKLFLNLDELPEFKVAAGLTLPTIIVNTPFSSIKEYELAMRYEYRRRYKKSRTSFINVNAISSDCSAFGESEYRLYLEVLKRSSGKLETLSQAFFANLPAIFKLTRFYFGEKLLGWHITVQYEETLYFFLGGIEYNLNNHYETYFNMLYDIIELGIRNKVKRVELGQTAEVPKLRTGGFIAKKYMVAQHSSPLFNSALKLAKGMLEYRCKLTQNHVFKEGTQG